MTAAGPLTLQRATAPRPVDEAFAKCERLARTHYENFSLGTRLLPRDARRHLYAIYAFCRGVDDLGDEAAGDRLALLDRWEAELRACYSGAPSHAYFVALQDTIHRFDIPPEPFLRLIEANRRDQTVKRYSDIDALLEYCQHSANPVGHLVLYVFGHRSREMQTLSDHTCTALQLTNFWQDVARDYAMGRIYIPREDMDRFGCREEDIASGVASGAFKQVLRFEIDRTRAMFRAGLPLLAKVVPEARLDIALFTAGGLAVLQAIERLDYDVLRRRPALSRWRKARLLATVLARAKLGLDPIPERTLR